MLAVFLLVIFALKWTTFGDPDRHADETFYFLVGQRMHEGMLPYVDIWDRKPLGLFLANYAIAGVSTQVIAYQVAACLLAALTAFVVALLVDRLAGRTGAWLAGIGYLFLINPVEGASGQAPDFYNALVAAAALLVLGDAAQLSRNTVGWRTWAAMALGGLALTFKQTTFFEAAFLGLWVLWSLRRAGAEALRLVRIAIGCCAVGLAPTLAIAGYYTLAGHWHEYWHAMVTSNFARSSQPVAAMGWRALSMVVRHLIVLPIAMIGVLSLPKTDDGRRFLICWIVAALAGLLSVPGFSIHYVLPLLVPIAVAAGVAFERMTWRLPAFAALICYSLIWQPIGSSAQARASAARMEHLAALVRAQDGGLLVYEGPHYLYAMTGKRLLSPLTLPYHLNDASENNVSHLDTHAEIDRVLAGRPGVIVVSRYPQTTPVNAYVRKRVLAYAHSRCRIIGSDDPPGQPPSPVATIVFGDCDRKP